MMRGGDDASCAFTTLQFDRALMMSSYVGTRSVEVLAFTVSVIAIRLSSGLVR
jgi:hypothetical protein